MADHALALDDLASRLRALESQKRALIATVHDLQAIVRLLSCNRLLIATDPEEED